MVPAVGLQHTIPVTVEKPLSLRRINVWQERALHIQTVLMEGKRKQLRHTLVVDTTNEKLKR